MLLDCSNYTGVEQVPNIAAMGDLATRAIGPNSVPAHRSAVVAEVLQLHADLEVLMLNGCQIAKTIGDRLNQLHREVPYGSWSSFVAEAFPFSLRTSQGYRQIANQWGRLEQICGEDCAKLGTAALLEIIRKINRIAPEDGSLLGEDSRSTYAVGTVVTIVNHLNHYHGRVVTVAKRVGLVHYAVIDGKDVPFLPGEMVAHSLAIAPGSKPARRTANYYRTGLDDICQKWGDKAPQPLVEELRRLIS